MGNAEFDRWREQIESALNQDPTYRAMKPVDMSWLVGYLQVDPVTGIAPGVDVLSPEGVRPMVWLPKWRYIVARFDGPGHTWDIDFNPGEWAIIRPGRYVGPPIVDGYLVTSPAVFGADVPEPPGRVDAPGTDGVGPQLAGDDGPARWLLLDGYCRFPKSCARMSEVLCTDRLGWLVLRSSGPGPGPGPGPRRLGPGPS